VRALKGSALNAADQKYVLAAYVHRYTREHIPSWTFNRDYPVQFASDADWLEHTLFGVTKNDRLDRRVKHCSSTPTWPDGAPEEIYIAQVAERVPNI
jgi:hypothetical protein